MTMISESGAIVDVNEIAAALEVPVDTIQAEDAAIATASLEDLLRDIEEVVVHNYNDDEPVFTLAPAVESVLHVAGMIQENGAISRSDAVTLKQMTESLEEFKGAFDCLPTVSYTELPSRVNYEASMESIFGNVGRKIVEIIKNIIKWIKEKSAALIGIFRDKRVKTAKAAEASKKVDEALQKSIKDAVDAFADAVNPEYREAARRPHYESVDLHMPSLFAHLTDNATSAKSVFHSIDSIVHDLGLALDGKFNLLKAAAKVLDKDLFQDPTEVKESGQDEIDAFGYFKAISNRLRETANDSDVITTTEPKVEIHKRLRMFDESLIMKTSYILAIKLTKTNDRAQKELNSILSEINKKTSSGERLASEDPLMVKAQLYRGVVQTASDINDIHSFLMSAWTKGIALGAKVAQNPSMGKAA